MFFVCFVHEVQSRASGGHSKHVCKMNGILVAAALIAVSSLS